MTLYLDIGNTRIKGAINNGPIEINFPAHELVLKNFMRNEVTEQEIVVSSVVPDLMRVFKNECKGADIRVLEINHKSLHHLNLKKVKRPETMGPDLICMLVAAKKMYPDKDLTVTSFGSATVSIGLKKDGTYLGGVFFSGIDHMADFYKGLGMVGALDFKIPEKSGPTANVKTSAQNGMLYAQIGAIVLARGDFLQEKNTKDWVHIATGGWAEKIAKVKPGLFDLAKKDLVMDGMRQIHQNQQAFDRVKNNKLSQNKV